MRYTLPTRKVKNEVTNVWKKGGAVPRSREQINMDKSRISDDTI